ncbi:MAG: PQQ-like beta-propeller repeat protein [Planctomycetes bacterium]|nr:PQQ-like beta-propeller repeat protein [Planctomycetota bacterium]
MTIAVLLPLFSTVTTHAQTPLERWSQFLGPHRDGVSAEKGLNLDWESRLPKVLWKKEVGGGFSSMSFGEHRLFTMGQKDGRIFALALDARTGEQLWKFDVCPAYTDQNNYSGPRSTPTYHNGRLFVLGPYGRLLCLRATRGSPIWDINVFKASGAEDRTGQKFYWGMTNSPLIEGNLVIVQPGGNGDNSVVAFHASDGRMVWGAGSDVPGYGSPVAITAAGRRQIICTTGQSIVSVDPADGELLWRHPWENKFNMNSANPLWVDGLLFISGLHEPGAAALEIVSEEGKVVAREKWHNEDLKNHFATSMIVDGYVYGTHGGGGCTLRCIDLKTGELKWINRATGKSTFIRVEDHLIAWSEDGTLRLVKPGPEKPVVKSEMKLLEPQAWAPPALSNGHLYVRDERHLVCLDLR